MNSCMRFIIPNFAAPDSFVDNVAATLRRMGHEVRTLPPFGNALFYSRAWRAGRLLARQLRGNGPSMEERWLLRTARDWKPDIVLTLTQALNDDTLAQLKKLGVGRRIAWWADPPANMAGMGLLSEHWDAVFLKDKNAVAKFRRVGIRADLLHEAMNPVWHRPICERENDSIAIVGNFYGYRQFLTLRLTEAGVPVMLHGGRLPRWVAPEIAARHSGRFLVRDEKSRIFGAALACLNSTSLSEGDSLNCRAFEIAGAGGLQLLEYRPAVEDCFEPGEELLVFDTFDELLGLVAWARENPKGARAVRQAGARRALAHHTYEHRLQHILDVTR
jgi:spore maturation protein CgeB